LEQVPGRRAAEMDSLWPSPRAWRERMQEIGMHIPDPRRPRITTVHNFFPGSLKTHMCVVFAPWSPADLNATAPEQGLFCTTCLYTERQNTLYTRESFKEHLQECRVGPDGLREKDDRQGTEDGSTYSLFWNMALTRKYH
jgi:hypothetical protein